jgi:hypothetical protein
MDFSFIYGDVQVEQISQPILPSEVWKHRFGSSQSEEVEG